MEEQCLRGASVAISALLDYGLNGPNYPLQVCQTRRLADLRLDIVADFDGLLLLLFLPMFVKMFCNDVDSVRG